MTIREALRQGTRLLEQAGIPAARLNAEVLLAHAAGHDRAWLYAHGDEELIELWWIHYGRYLHERLSGKPTQYITKRQEFYGREFLVTPDVLIPRPETEHLVEAAIEKLAHGAGPVIDVGCGSGAIAISVALETGAAVIGSDISVAALRVADRNRRRWNAQVQLVASDVLSAFRDGCSAMILSNPPYVPESNKEVTQREVRDYEPHIALFGGPDGFDLYRRLIADAARVLRPGGWLLMEIAYNASGRIRDILGSSWRDVEIRTDLAGLPRVALARLSE
ncbi:MAG TPA: peptide chain release factor N(5)-glutamine methyltransferase [Bryobacteraceae bacterium]|nr:peptide chain release factor N(5)-glutamine methyltransferase [Bryobacteraceae bacterium]